MIDLKELQKLITNKDISNLSKFIKENNLILKDGKLLISKEESEKVYEYWDRIQISSKYRLNSTFGAALNAGFRFFDKRLGQSTTLTGRQVAKHMASKVNELLTGKYDHTGSTIIYGDSVTGDTKIRTTLGEFTIEEMYRQCTSHFQSEGKDYGVFNQAGVIGFDSYEMECVQASISHIMRHNTCKNLFKIITESGKSITVTEDHSVMVDRDGVLLDVKPNDIMITSDLVITLVVEEQGNHAKWEHIDQIIELGETRDYVYDLSILDQDPLFFGNDILVHNTDSVMFSGWKAFKEEIENGNLIWNRDSVVQIYDAIGEEVNQSFPDFMKQACNCPTRRGAVVRAGRELVAEKGIFITKKRYAMMYYDKEGKRLDVDGKPGKLKAMGLDLKRSDTPKFMQDFLRELLNKLLTDGTREDIMEMVKLFRAEFRKRHGWDMGSPKRVNGLTKFTLAMNDMGKTNMPGHVRASINWNALREMNGDRYSAEIMDGNKVIVCKLRNNALGFTSVAYPVDELRLPEWFKELPFDKQEMEAIILDKKVDNLIGVLGWDLAETRGSVRGRSFFSFE